MKRVGNAAANSDNCAKKPKADAGLGHDDRLRVKIFLSCVAKLLAKRWQAEHDQDRTSSHGQ